MKLLVVTQKVDKNDENLGAFYYWFEKLGEGLEKVVLIVSSLGPSPLAANTEAYSLGKEKGRGRIGRIWKFWEFFSHHYAKADAVLFHQIPEFAMAAAPFLVSLRKPSGLWYAHKSVTWKLKVAERIVDHVFTSSPEGFRLPSKKVHYVGQAIHTEMFRPPSSISTPETLRLLTVGRISPVKNYETLLRASLILKEKWNRTWILSIVGGGLMARDAAYLESLKKFVKENDLLKEVHFYGSRPYSEIPSILQEHDFFVNLSRTGSLDKAVLEAMSSGLTVLTSNEAYRSLLPPQYFLELASPEFLAGRIMALAGEKRPNLMLRDIVLRHHSLERTIEKIIATLRSL